MRLLPSEENIESPSLGNMNNLNNQRSINLRASTKPLSIPIACALWLPLVMLLLLPTAGRAQYNYATNNGGITITDYTGAGGAVTIPSTITGLPVTRIGVQAFASLTNVTSVVIPTSVTTIGNSAFSSCIRLARVTIPSSVTRIEDFAFQSCSSLAKCAIPNSVGSIGDLAFASCTHLTGVTIGSGVTNIGDSAFYYCYNLTGLVIPSSVTRIGNSAFSTCIALTGVTLGKNVTEIGNAAFSSCRGLTRLLLPNSLTNIGNAAFNNCYKLTSVTIPTNVTTIGTAPFAGCTNLSMITVGALNSFYSSVNGVLFNKSQTTLIECPGGKSGTYTAPNSVTNIAGQAFGYCPKLTSVILSNSVISIGGGAFSNCYKLSNVTIPNSVTTIGSAAFISCISLTNVTIPSGVTNIDKQLFSSCSNLVNVTLPGGVISIGNSAFYSCVKLTNSAIPSSVTNIGVLTFSGCARFTNVMIASNVAGIGQEAFSACTNLSMITVDALNPFFSSVDGVLFNKTKTKLLQCPGGKTGTYAISNSVTTVAGYAFESCVGLTNVTIPSSVTTVANLAFYNCSSLEEITVDPLNTRYSSVDGILFNKGRSTLIQCPATKGGDYTIPSSVTSIGTYAFYSCTNLVNLTIPTSVTSLGNNAFRSCTRLIGIYFLGNGPGAGSSVFYGDAHASVYYQPGTTGWFPTLSGFPTIKLVSLPPAPTIVSPANYFQTGSELQTIRGHVPSGAPITHVVYEMSNTCSGLVVATSTAAGTTNWTAGISLLPGTNLFRVRAANLFSESKETVASYFLLRTNIAAVMTDGSGQVSPSYSGKGLLIGRGYPITALPGPNQILGSWVANGVTVSRSASFSFIMQSNLVLQANFIPNPFPPVVGTYNGLFYDTNNLSQGSSGYLTLTVSSNQALNGKILLDGGTNTLSGSFDSAGLAQLTIPRKSKGALTVMLQLDLTNNTDTIVGSISSTNFTSQLTALRSVFSATQLATNFTGNYVVVITGSTNAALAPAGYGYGLYRVSTNGLVAFSGFLADGTAINAGGPLLKGGAWPLYARLYNGQGSFSAWANFAPPSEHVDAPFPLWFKNPVTTGAMYRNGFSLSSSTLSMNGAVHVTPPAGTPYLNYTNAVAYLADGNLLSNSAQNMTIDSNNVIAVTSGTNQLAISLNVTNGVFSGTFIHPATHLSTAIKGAFPANTGFGYFLGTNQSGAIIIEGN